MLVSVLRFRARAADEGPPNPGTARVTAGGDVRIAVGDASVNATTPTPTTNTAAAAAAVDPVRRGRCRLSRPAD